MKQTEGRVTFNYRFDSEDNPPLPLRLKVEINTREHFAVGGFISVPFAVSSRWFGGSGDITTYELNELLGTKLRALYQRRKGRDLFDLARALEHGAAEPAKIVEAFQQYMEHRGHVVARSEFEENLGRKLLDPDFGADLGPLLAGGYEWNPSAAATTVRGRLLALLP